MWESENSGVTVQVWEKDDRRELRFGNHIMQSVFSKIRPNQLVLPYSRFMLLGLLFCTEPKTVLHIGLGGGSIVRWMHREFPETKHTVIEKNSAVIEAARLFFELPQDNRLRLLKGDVTEIIPTLIEKFDIILLDGLHGFWCSGRSETCRIFTEFARLPQFHRLACRKYLDNDWGFFGTVRDLEINFYPSTSGPC